MIRLRWVVATFLLLVAALACLYWPSAQPVPELSTSEPGESEQQQARYAQWLQRHNVQLTATSVPSSATGGWQ